jgi:hypothetical protein
MERFLPTLEVARKAHLALPDEEPTEQRKMAALILDLRIIRREVWSETKNLTLDERNRLDPHPPTTVKAGAMYHVLGAEYGGPGRFSRCRIDHYTDKAVVVNDVYTPDEMTSVPALSHLDDALDAIAVGAKLPSDLRCLDLAPRTAGGGYRAVAAEVKPDFHGYSFGGAFEATKGVVDAILRRGAAVGGEVVVHAWPLLWLRYEGPIPEIVVFYDPKGELHAYTGFPEI